MTFKNRFLQAVLGAVLLHPELAGAGESAGLRRMLRARTPVQFARVLKEEQKLRRSRLVCESQLRSKRVPEACFEVVALTKVHIEFASSDRFDGATDLKWLEGLCVSRAEGSNDWTELQRASKNSRLPARCREAVIKRRDDLSYADQSERPAEVFVRHFPAKE